MKNIKSYLLIFICIGCATSKSGKTDLCLHEVGIPSIVEEIIMYETPNKKIGTLRGQIKDRIDSLPSKEVIIFSEDFKSESGYYSTDSAGNFVFQLPEGIYELKFSSLESDELTKTVTVENGKATDLKIYMGIADSWTYFTTDNPKELKKRIRKQNKKRKREYSGEKTVAQQWL